MSEGNSIRRDAEPDRAPLLELLVVVSVFLGVISLCAVLPCLVGLPLSVAVCEMTARDQAKTYSGLMDPRARHTVKATRRFAVFAVAINLLALFWGVTVVAIVFLGR
jgi:hypothetical protein